MKHAPHEYGYRITPRVADRLKVSGFKAGQSPRGRLGYRVECAQTIAAGMSAIEPTVVMSFPAAVTQEDEKNENSTLPC